MTIPVFLKRKKTYLILALIVAAGLWYMQSRAKANQKIYETVAVEQRDLAQTVEVTGQLKPVSRIDLAFKNSGTVNAVNVKVGDQVKKDQLLAKISNADVLYAARSAGANLAIAQSNLRARLAGETAQSIRVSETQVEQAKASLQKAQTDLASIMKTTQDTVKNAEVALRTAKNNLDNQDAVVTQNIQNAYDSARSALLTAMGPLSTGLTDGDQIIGVDDVAANSTFVNLLGVLDTGSVTRARMSYADAKRLYAVADGSTKSLSGVSTKEQIQAAANDVQAAIGAIQTYLTDVQKVLAATLTSSSFTSAQLATKKSTIDADRVAVSAQSSAVLSATQALKNTELTRIQTISQLQDAYTTAQTNYQTAKTTAETQVHAAEAAVVIQRAAVDAAQATLDQKKAPPREVDVASLRAAIIQAQANLEKATNDLKNCEIIAPVDGTIAEVIPDLGEEVTMNAPVIRMVGTDAFDIEAQVPEADIAKVLVGQVADITLDAFGDDVKFTGTVTAEDPDQTKIQDAVYYRIHVLINRGDRDVKPGMTANVTVHTGDRKNVLVIPLRAVRTLPDGVTKVVRVLVNGQPQERTIELGLRGDEGRVEVVQGLTQGEAVVVSESTPGSPNP